SSLASRPGVAIGYLSAPLSTSYVRAPLRLGTSFVPRKGWKDRLPGRWQPPEQCGYWRTLQAQAAARPPPRSAAWMGQAWRRARIPAFVAETIRPKTSHPWITTRAWRTTWG